MIENGFLQRWRLRFYPQDVCSLRHAGGGGGAFIGAASLVHVQGAFILLAAGLATAGLVLFMELAVSLGCQLLGPRSG